MTPSSVEEKTVKSLRNLFYLGFGILILAFLTVLFDLFHLKEASRGLSVETNQYMLILTIVSIPFALKAFSVLLYKKPRPENVSEAVKVYKKAYYVRLFWLFLVTFGNIVLYAVTYSRNYLWLTVILLLVFLLCKPSVAEYRKIVPVENGDE